MSSKKTAIHITSEQSVDRAFNIEQDIHIAGEFRGSLFSDKDLFVEKTGVFIGEAHVANAYIRGSFQGNLEAFQQVFLTETSIFKGILDCPKANISLGAECCGDIRIASRGD
jgi:cytoskeletal protein CcmA (bactofilin family)